MSNLKRVDQLPFEKLFDMQTGYVWGFSNQTFGDFVLESTGVDVYAAGYDSGGTSKSSRLRTFWRVESDHKVLKLLRDLLAYWRQQKKLSGDMMTLDEGNALGECERVLEKFATSAAGVDTSVIDVQRLDQQLSALADSVRKLLDQGEPEQALDRLHTYSMRLFRLVCDRNGIGYAKTDGLAKLFGAYASMLESKGYLQSEMSKRVFKTTGNVLDAFDTVRNNQTFAHDNPILSKLESQFILKNVFSIIWLINAIEKRVNQSAVAAP